MTKTEIRKMKKIELVKKLRHEYFCMEVSTLWNKEMLVNRLYDLIKIDSMSDRELFEEAYKRSIENGMKAWS